MNEIIFFLENKYLPHNEERGTFIEDIPSQECLFTFEEMSDSIKKKIKMHWRSRQHDR